MFKIINQKLSQHLVDDEHRYRFQIIFLPLMAGMIALGMSILNFFTDESLLMAATFLFSMMCFACSIMSALAPRLVNAAYIIFCLLLLIICAFFVVNGAADGFSSLWVLLMPACGPIFVGNKRGTLFCGIFFALLVFLMWTPCGRSYLMYEYTETFLLRFPILYASTYIIGFFFETARRMTYDSLKATQRELWLLSVRDGMTGVNNHARFTQDLDTLLNDDNEHTAGFIYADINGLKFINDTQSHDVGDRMIYDCVKVLLKHFDKNICYRMGGDEFIVFLRDCTEDDFQQQLELLRCDYSKAEGISVAVGGAYASCREEIREAVIAADSDMQSAKINYYRQAGIDRRKY